MNQRVGIRPWLRARVIMPLPASKIGSGDLDQSRRICVNVQPVANDCGKTRAKTSAAQHGRR